jgi:hypothetical protein
VLASLALSLAAHRRPPARARPEVPRGRADSAPPASTGGLRRVGVVRFNPYHDTGGEYSFAVALLDEGGSGLLLTGLYHRDQSRVYAKEVGGWAVPGQELMEEEREAIERARGGEPL